MTNSRSLLGLLSAKWMIRSSTRGKTGSKVSSMTPISTASVPRSTNTRAFASRVDEEADLADPVVGDFRMVVLDALTKVDLGNI